MPCCFSSWLIWPLQRFSSLRNSPHPPGSNVAVLEILHRLRVSRCIIHLGGSSTSMRPAKLGALEWCFVTSALLGVMALAPLTRAQTVLETPQQTNDRIRTLSSTAHLSQHDYVIGRGDVVAVDVFDVKELSRDVRVSQTGSIGLPLVPVRLQVAGLTEIQTEQKIAEVLEANGLVSHPQVSVTVKERRSKPITVVGAVLHTMVYQADRPVTILEVLAEAGGIASYVFVTLIAPRSTLFPSTTATPI